MRSYHRRGMFLALYIPATLLFGTLAFLAPVVVNILLSVTALAVSSETHMDGNASLLMYSLLLSFIASMVIGLVGAAFPNRTRRFIRAVNAYSRRE